MVLRRCRFIVVSDAGCDPAYSCGDLANAIRKIRIDFGIDIEFPHGLQVAPHRADAAHGRGAATVRFAVGTIGYSAIDPAIENGVLIYLKPTIVGDEPVDVANYAGTHPSFPHESTAEQWFDEAQFESYRALGLQTVRALCGGGSFDSPRDLCLAAQQGQL
jgi:hypothetical protein